MRVPNFYRGPAFLPSTKGHEIASQCAASIREVWAACGFKVDVQVGLEKGNRRVDYPLRSNLINGLPRDLYDKLTASQKAA